ncbi:MAG: hypothetical protein M0Z31_02285 [Clostridia bacterium]|nr:hypothetical protein [Clostridia bacterium]
MTLANKTYQSWITPLAKYGSELSDNNVGLAITEITGGQGHISLRVNGLESWRDCPDAGSSYRVWLVAKNRLGPTFVSLGVLKTDTKGLGTGEFPINLEDVGETGRSIEEFTHLMVTIQSPDDLWPSAETVATGNFKSGQLVNEDTEEKIEQELEAETILEVVENQEMRIDQKEPEGDGAGEESRSFDCVSKEANGFEQFQPFDPSLPGHRWWKIPELS